MKRGNFKIYSNFEYFIPGTKQVLILMVWFVVGVLLGNAVSAPMMFLGLGTDAVIPVAYVFMFIPPMIFAASRSRLLAPANSGLKLDNNHFKPVGGALSCCILVVVTLALGVISDAFTAMLPEMPERLRLLLESMTGGNFWINFFCVSLCAPFFEEWLCRGTILRGLLGNGMKPWAAILFSSVVFAVIHANPWQAIPALLLGAFFGYVYYKTGSLKLTMLMHFVNNTFALVCAHIDSIKDIETMKELLGNSYVYVLTASVCIVVLAIVEFRKIPLISEKGNFDEIKPLFSE